MAPKKAKAKAEPKKAESKKTPKAKAGKRSAMAEVAGSAKVPKVEVDDSKALEELLGGLQETTWKEALSDEFGKDYFADIARFVQAERSSCTVHPPTDQVFSAFNETPFDKVRVVIIGQDPYHEPGQAHGMCFSVRPGIKTPPSLANIYKELEIDIPGFQSPGHGYLLSWAQQGVLLLNATLTVREGHKEANSHASCGWQRFTDEVIKALNEKREGVVFLLWGNFAQKKALFSCLDTDNDDEIEYSEFLAAALIGRVQVHEDLLRKTFGRFDKSESGSITAENLRCVLGEHFGAKEMEDLIREADKSGHGQIDYDEFLAYFYRSDTDGLTHYSVLPPMGTQGSIAVPAPAPIPAFAAQSDMGFYGKMPSAWQGSVNSQPPTWSVQSAPVSQEAWEKRKARTFKLGAVIDHLLGAGDPKGGIRRRDVRDVRDLAPPASEPHAAQPKVTNCKVGRPGLPTLLPQPTSPQADARPSDRKHKAEL